MKKSPIKKGFRPGPCGACEAHLFEFVRFAEDDAAEDLPRLIGAVSLLEAVMFLERDDPTIRIRAVEHRGIVLLLSGTPYA